MTKAETTTPFSRRVAQGMRDRGFTLRQFCRAVDLDPSFFSKVLSGKRSPPASEEVLRRIARLLALDAAELIVSAGRIPSEWSGLWADRALFRDIHSLATTPKRPVEAPRGEAPPPPLRAPAAVAAARQELSEELL